MAKRKKNNDKENKKKAVVIEDGVRIHELKGWDKSKLKGKAYLMYFDEFKTITIFKTAVPGRDKTELPEIIIYLKDAHVTNLNVPGGLSYLKLIVKDDIKFMTLSFEKTSKRGDFFDFIRKEKTKMKDKKYKEQDSEYCNYTRVEMKYKIAKVLESQDFEAFQGNYDYRKYLSFKYFSKFNEIYNKSSKTYKDLYNKFFMGRFSIVSKKSKLKRKRLCQEQNR